MGELTHDANECLGLLPRESRGAKRLLVLLRVHELDFAIVADADARLCRVKIAAPDAGALGTKGFIDIVFGNAPEAHPDGEPRKGKSWLSKLFRR